MEYDAIEVSRLHINMAPYAGVRLPLRGITQLENVRLNRHQRENGQCDIWSAIKLPTGQLILLLEPIDAAAPQKTSNITMLYCRQALPASQKQTLLEETLFWLNIQMEGDEARIRPNTQTNYLENLEVPYVAFVKLPSTKIYRTAYTPTSRGPRIAIADASPA
jgi:hypothetical protein